MEYDDSELEDRVFHAAAIGGLDPEMSREELNKLIRDLWSAYCEMEANYLEMKGKVYAS